MFLIPIAWPKAVWCCGFDHAIPELIFGTLECGSERYLERCGLIRRLKQIGNKSGSGCIARRPRENGQAQCLTVSIYAGGRRKVFNPRIHRPAPLRAAASSRPTGL
jgi:hypothetical protein